MEKAQMEHEKKRQEEEKEIDRVLGLGQEELKSPNVEIVPLQNIENVPLPQVENVEKKIMDEWDSVDSVIKKILFDFKLDIRGEQKQLFNVSKYSENMLITFADDFTDYLLSKLERLFLNKRTEFGMDIFPQVGVPKKWILAQSDELDEIYLLAR